MSAEMVPTTSFCKAQRLAGIDGGLPADMVDWRPLRSGEHLMKRNPTTIAAAAAGLLWLAAVLGFGAMLEGYAHPQHPVALLGARGIERALAFNVLGFVLPGLLVAWAALRLRGSLDAAGWLERVGARLWLLSALAFAAQGLVPLDPEDLDAGASRLHATIWSLWWIAFLPGALLLAVRSRGFALALLLAAVVVVVAVLLAPAGLAQRVVVVAWFALVAAAGRMRWRKATAASAAVR